MTTPKATPRQRRQATRKASAPSAPPKKRAAPRKNPAPRPQSPPNKRPSAPPAAPSRPPAANPDPLEDIPRTVADLVLAGLGKDQVRAFLLAEAQYRPGKAELDALIEQAKADLAGQADHYAEIATELTVVRLNDLYTRAIKASDLKTALDVQKAIVNFLIGKAPASRTGRPAAAEQPAAAEDPPAEELAAGGPVQHGQPRLVGGYSDVMGKRKRA